MDVSREYLSLRAELRHLTETVKALRKDELSDMLIQTDPVMKAYFEGKADAFALIADYLTEHLTEEEAGK